MSVKKTKTPEPWPRVVEELRERSLLIENGLTEVEARAVELRFGFRFPPDLRAFLQAGLPVGKGFPDWRDGNEKELRNWFDIPRQGIVFDVRHGIWVSTWGPRPTDTSEAVNLVEALIRKAPVLVPVFKHRMMPAEPHKPGNPVFSVHQKDIIHYGNDLVGYLRNEFQVAEWWTAPIEPRPIPFWDVDRFQAERWGDDGSAAFDNSRGVLP